MKNIIISAVAAAITAGTLIAAPAALADEPDPAPAVPVLTSSGLILFPFEFPGLTGEPPRSPLTREPRYEPDGISLGVREVRGVRGAYSMPASNPSA